MEKIYSRGKVKFLKLVSIIIISIITASIVINSINPIIDKQCRIVAKSIATKISNKQVSNVMNEYRYEDLCTIIKDENENIKLISANIININEIMSNVAIKIEEELNNSNKGTFYIPLGSFTGSKILSGRGPNVEIKINTAGNVDTSLKSEFISSGINQTLHKVYLEVKCNVIVLTPFDSIEESITNQILLAEAIIVGITPNTYYNLEGLNKNEKIDIIE